MAELIGVGFILAVRTGAWKKRGGREYFRHRDEQDSQKLQQMGGSNWTGKIEVPVLSLDKVDLRDINR